MACGAYRDLKEAAEIFVKPGKEYFPNKERHERYQQYYQKYKKLYPAVASVLKEEGNEK